MLLTFSGPAHCRWLGHGTVAILTLHGWGYWTLWLWEGIYPRGLYWDPYGSNMLSGGLAWFAGALLWVTSLAYIRRHFFEVCALGSSSLKLSTHDLTLAWTHVLYIGRLDQASASAWATGVSIG